MADSVIRARRLPSPGVQRPDIAWPTVGLAAVSLTIWVAAAIAMVDGALSPWVGVPVNAFASFAMFTVMHDAAHRGVGRVRVANEILGRIGVPFVATYASFPLFRHIHLTHHRFVNEGDDVDPDSWVIHAPLWVLPFRWLVVDLHYASFYLKGWRGRPRAEIVESVAVAIVSIGGIIAAFAVGWGPQILLVYLVPQRLALIMLAWWFDWLPHHGLDGTTTDRRLQSTRNIVGWEWLLTPLLFGQNYHLLHHVHPIVPFYRYVQAWRNGEEDYLEHDPSLSTISGQTVSAEDYRSIRGLDATTV